MGEKGEARLLRCVEGEHAAEVEINQSVAIKHEELFLKVRYRIDQGASRSTGRCFLEAAEANAKLAAIAEMVANHIRTVMDQEENIIDALVAKKFDGALEQRNAEDRGHRLRDIHPESLREAGSFSASQDDSLHQRFSAAISATANFTASGEVICAPQPSWRSLAVE
jgi:hypothetical protein